MTRNFQQQPDRGTVTPATPQGTNSSDFQMPSDDEIQLYLNEYMRSIAFPEFVRQFFITKAKDNVTINSGDTEILIETLEDSQDAFYLPPSVTVNVSAIVDCYQTAGVVGGGIASGVQCSILKRRMTLAPDVTNVILLISNTFPPLNISYRVCRLAVLF